MVCEKPATQAKAWVEDFLFLFLQFSEKMLIFALDKRKGLDYELLGNGTIGTDERGCQCYYKGGFGRAEIDFVALLC